MPTAKAREGIPNSSAMIENEAPVRTRPQGRLAFKYPVDDGFHQGCLGSAGNSTPPNPYWLAQQENDPGNYRSVDNGTGKLSGLLPGWSGSDQVSGFKVLGNVAGNGRGHAHDCPDSQDRDLARHVSPAQGVKKHAGTDKGYYGHA